MRGFVQVLKTVIALVLHFELETSECAQPLHGRRLDSNDQRPGNTEHGAANAVQNSCGTLVFTLPLRIRLQCYKNQAAIGCAPAKTEARHCKRASNLRHRLGDRRYLLSNFAGVLQRRSRGSLHNDNQISLVLIWNEALRNSLKYEICQPESGRKEDERHRLVAQERAQSVDIAAGDHVNHAIDPLEEPVLLAVLAAEQQRRQSGRKR